MCWFIANVEAIPAQGFLQHQFPFLIALIFEPVLSNTVLNMIHSRLSRGSASRDYSLKESPVAIAQSIFILTFSQNDFLQTVSLALTEQWVIKKRGTHFLYPPPHSIYL